MSRKLAQLTVETFGGLPEAERSCLFWQYDAVHRARSRTDAERAKEAWLSAVLREWGPCGQVIVVDEVVAGYALYAPAAFLPGVGGFATAPVSPDAVVLASVYVDPGRRGGGLGRMLVQGTVRELVRRGDVRAVEGFAARPGRQTACVLPEEFWLTVGFRTHREHRAHPRMRLDLRSTASWREEVETALEKLLGAVRPVPRPRLRRELLLRR